ncbi:hypothetical protein AAG906_010735 [Vitis piasezkii]
MSCKESELWYNSMKDEMSSMKCNDVWDLVELPNGAKAIGCKWVLEKKESLSNIERYKAKLVAKGFTRKEGIGYMKTFSPVSKKDSLCIILALVAYFDLELQQMDVKTTFLNGELEEEVYMKQPEGFPSSDENVMDQCIYLKVSGSKVCFLVLYVDDILLATNDKGLLHEVKQFLSKNFDMKDMGEASYVIGIKIHRGRFQDIFKKPKITSLCRRTINLEVVGYLDSNFASVLIHVNQHLDTFLYWPVELYLGGALNRP